jgi:hypothetical protein
MNSYTSFVRPALTCLLAVAVTAIASAFEGKVEMTMTSSRGDGTMPMTYYLKGTNMRIEMTTPPDKHNKNGGTFASIMDLEKKEMIMLMPEQKMYMVHKIPDSTVEKANAKAAEADFKPTGKKEKIAGIEAEEYVGTSDKKRTELWVTKELGKFMMANQGKGGKKGAQSSAWAKFAEQGDFFALRVIQRAKEGAPEDMRMEVTKVEKGAQSDSLFKPPADYQQFEMPNMGDMMKGMMEAPAGAR